MNTICGCSLLTALNFTLFMSFTVNPNASGPIRLIHGEKRQRVDFYTTGSGKISRKARKGRKEKQ